MKFELVDSRLLRGVLLIVHGLAALMVAVASLPLLVRLALIGLLILSAFYYLRRSRERVQIEIAKDSSCMLLADGAHPIECRILPRSFVAAYLVILHLQSTAGVKYVIITPDRIDIDTFRRLRVFLRWGVRPGQH